MDDINIPKLNKVISNLERCIDEYGRRIEKLERSKGSIVDTFFEVSFDELNTMKNTILHLDEKLDKIQNDLDHILRPKDLDIKFKDILDKKG